MPKEKTEDKKICSFVYSEYIFYTPRVICKLLEPKMSTLHSWHARLVFSFFFYVCEWNVEFSGYSKKTAQCKSTGHVHSYYKKKGK